MTPLQKEFYRRQCAEFVANWPEGAPAEMAHLSRDEVAECIAEYDRAEQMPDAELFPEVVPLRKAARAYFAESWEATCNLGRIYLEVRQGGGNVAAFAAQYTPDVSAEEIDFAIRAAQERADS